MHQNPGFSILDESRLVEVNPLKSVFNLRKENPGPRKMIPS